MGGQAGQTAHALGAQTVSASRSQRIWIRLEIVALVSPDQYLSQRYHFGNGSFSESLSSPIRRPILAAPFAEVTSPNPIGPPSGELHTSSAPPSCSRPLSTTDPSPLTYPCGLTTSLTLISVRDVPTVFAPTTFWLSLRPQPPRSSEELSRHTGRACRRQRVGTESLIWVQATAHSWYTNSGLQLTVVPHETPSPCLPRYCSVPSPQWQRTARPQHFGSIISRDQPR